MIQWQTQKLTASVDNFLFTIERQSYDGTYIGTIDIWDDLKGYQRFGVYQGRTLEEAKYHAEELRVKL